MTYDRPFSRGPSMGESGHERSCRLALESSPALVAATQLQATYSSMESSTLEEIARPPEGCRRPVVRVDEVATEKGLSSDC